MLSLFNPPHSLLIRCYSCSPTNHLLLKENHRSLIQICITSPLESTSRFISSASPVLSRFISFTSQPIYVIIATLIIHHSFTFSLQAQNLPFQQILPTLTFLLYSLDCLHDNGTGPDLSRSSVYFLVFFLLHFCSFRVVD